MSVQAMSWAIEVGCPNSSAKLVLMCLANYADRKGYAYPGQKSLAKDSGLGVRTVQRTLDALVEAGLISKNHRQRDNGSRTSDEYFLNLKSNTPNLHDGPQSNTSLTTIQPATVTGPNIEPSVEPSDKNTPLTPQADCSDEIQSALKAWNDLAEEHDLPRVQKLTATRQRSLKRRLKDCGGLPGWLAACAMVAESPGLLGDNNRGWKIKFDFMISESGFTKIMEGNYKNWGKTNGKQSDLDDFKQWAAESLDQH